MSIPAQGVYQYARQAGNRTHERGEVIASGSGTYANNATIGTLIRFDLPEPLVIDPFPGAQYAMYVYNPSTVTLLNVRLLNTPIFPVSGRRDVNIGLFTVAAATGTPQVAASVLGASMWMVSNGGFSVYITNATALGAADTFTFEWMMVRI